METLLEWRERFLGGRGDWRISGGVCGNGHHVVVFVLVVVVAIIFVVRTVSAPLVIIAWQRRRQRIFRRNRRRRQRSSISSHSNAIIHVTRGTRWCPWWSSGRSGELNTSGAMTRGAGRQRRQLRAVEGDFIFLRIRRGIDVVGVIVVLEPVVIVGGY